MLTEPERSAILDAEIQRWVGQGYRLVTRTSTAAQMVKPKSFSVAVAIFGLLFLVVGLLIYLLAYAAQSDEALYLSVDEHGRIQRRGSEGTGGRDVAGQWFCDACSYRNHRQRTLCKRCKAPRP